VDFFGVKVMSFIRTSYSSDLLDLHVSHAAALGSVNSELITFEVLTYVLYVISRLFWLTLRC